MGRSKLGWEVIGIQRWRYSVHEYCDLLVAGVSLSLGWLDSENGVLDV